MPEEVVHRLRDGEPIAIRPLRPEDREGLRQGIERLSPRSRYRRFFSGAAPLGERELRYLTELDHHDHEALLAIDPRTRDGIGVARFVRSGEDRASAEVAVAVSDEWQRRGVGTCLMLELAARARAEGVRRFSASVLAENEAVLEMLRAFGATVLAGPRDGVIELLMDVPQEGMPPALGQAVRAAARGELRSP